MNKNPVTAPYFVHIPFFPNEDHCFILPQFCRRGLMARHFQSTCVPSWREPARRILECHDKRNDYVRLFSNWFKWIFKTDKILNFEFLRVLIPARGLQCLLWCVFRVNLLRLIDELFVRGCSREQTTSILISSTDIQQHSWHSWHSCGIYLLNTNTSL